MPAFPLLEGLLVTPAGRNPRPLGWFGDLLPVSCSSPFTLPQRSVALVTSLIALL